MPYIFVGFDIWGHQLHSRRCQALLPLVLW